MTTTERLIESKPRKYKFWTWSPISSYTLNFENLEVSCLFLRFRCVEKHWSHRQIWILSSSLLLEYVNEDLRNRIIMQEDIPITSHSRTGRQLAFCFLLHVISVFGILWRRDVNRPCPWELTMKLNKLWKSYIKIYIK